jgi:uncharacterized protein
LLIKHSEQVKGKAIEITKKHPELRADQNFIAEAAMLHDIGVFLCHAPQIYCYGTHHYIEHGYLGADILRNEGLERHALVCERHTGTGFTKETIMEKNLPLPHRDMRPVSIEEEIICYADKFFSKTRADVLNDLDRIRQSIKKHDESNVQYFELWHAKFS